MSTTKPITRRELLKTAAVVAPVAMTGCATLTGEEDPLVRTDDPVARALGYHEDTGEVAADHPLAGNHSVDQKCANCVHSRGSIGPGQIECPMFPGRTVNANGWCSVWAEG